MKRILPLLALAALLAAGCASANEDLGTKGGDINVAAQKKAIEDNPNMPPQAKAAAQAQIDAHSKSASGGPDAGK